MARIKQAMRDPDERKSNEISFRLATGGPVLEINHLARYLKF